MFMNTWKHSITKRNTRVCFAKHGNNKGDENNNQNSKYFGSKFDQDNGYLLFQSDDIKVPINLQDVREAYECCSGIANDSLKATCYRQFGVDGKMAEKYFKKIKNMEDLYYKQWEYRSYDENSKEKKKNDKGMFRKWFKFEKDFDE